MNTFQLTVATVDEVLLKENVLAVYFPTPNGERGVLTNHETYLTDTKPGRIRYVNKDRKVVPLDLKRSGVFFIKNNEARLWVC